MATISTFGHVSFEYESGVPVLKDDTPDTLAKRVFAAECEAYPEAVRIVSRKTEPEA